MTRARTTLLLVIVLALLVGLVVFAAVATRSDDSSFVEPTPVSTAPPEGLGRFYDQQLDWSSCGEGQCTWVKVPIDYAEPQGETTRVRVKVLPGDGAERSLFVNPGGPGGSALDFADTLYNRFSSDVLKTYDVVGVDPRGVGESTPVDCLTDEEFDAYVALDPNPPLGDADQIAALRRESVRFGESCLKQSGPLAEHVSTVEAARDMDVVRALLGRTKMDWFGASYGTLLGGVYAELFPDTVGRMVLDGAVDPELDNVERSFAQATGFQRALTAYIESCVTKSSCPLGTDPDAALDRIVQLLKDVDAKPLPGLDDRDLTERHAFYGIAVTLYDQSSWPYLTQALEAALDGDGSILMGFSDVYFERDQQGRYANNSGEVISVVNCLDSPGTGSVEAVEREVPRFTKASPVFGPILAWGALGCTDFPLEADNPLPKIDAKGAPPIVVVGTTRDPATPYESAEALASQLDSGVLLTREGDGHTAYMSRNRCIVDAVDAFLIKGTVPAEGTTCKES